MSKNKVLVIVGQTATGKSKLAVRLAKKFHGEIISADSRQVYKGLDLGTGKITKKEMRDVPHHLLNVVNPKTRFTVSRYKKLAEKKLKEIIARKKVPIICGGTGFYLDAVTKGMVLPEVPPNPTLRKKLAFKSDRYLMLMLQKLDPKRAKNIDPKNKVRLIRAIEIVRKLGQVPRLATRSPNYEFIKIGLQVPTETLKRKIKFRLKKRLRAGMAIEVYDLNKKGVPWKRFLELGFDQRYTALYLQGKINEREMLEKLFKENWQYAKRQMTWFKRDPEIKWFDPRAYRKILE
ncbi:MAG: tRNA (adenosine(37)-N6)-dimethylallyltransferase MiaA, partial [Patescibacteria group bacterium]